MIKLVIADLDGTLYHDNCISKQTKKTIERLRKDGIIFTIATRRHITASMKIIKELNVKGPVICSNGAYVGIPGQNKMLKEVLMDTHLVMRVLDRLSISKSKFLLYTSKRIVGTKESREALYNKIGEFPSHVVSLGEVPLYVNEGIVKILIIESNENTFNDLYEEFQKYPEFSVVSSNNGFIDIGCRQSSKGNGLVELCKYHEVSLDEVFAIGDQGNDLSMLQVAGIGVAMGNSSETLKKSVDIITESIENEGFTHAINRFVYEES